MKETEKVKIHDTYAMPYDEYNEQNRQERRIANMEGRCAILKVCSRKVHCDLREDKG